MTKCILRKWSTSDLEALVGFANNVNIARFLTDAFPFPYTKEAGEKFLAAAMEDMPIRMFAVDVGGEALGSVGISLQTDIRAKNAELGYMLAEPHWGRGIMTDAVKQMVEYAFDTFDITRIFTRPFGNNKASHRVLEKAGFKLEATFVNTVYKNGEFLDERFYAVRRDR